MSRSKNKIQNCLNMKDIYNDYIKDKDYNSVYYVTFQDFLDITKEYYKEIARQLIYDCTVVKLPFRLGHLYVGKKKPKVLSASTLSPDWEATRKYGKMIRHINDHSGGFKFRYIWAKKQCFVVNQDIYRLVFSRDNKRTLAKAIKSGNYDYSEI
jgi:hypothetical protein